MRKNYKESNPEKYKYLKKMSDKRYSKKHRKKLNKIQVNKYHTDKQYKLKVTIRNRINIYLKEKKITKYTSSTHSIGCDYETLEKHLESQFTDGMNWDNHALDGWHIDHIIPLDYYDLSDPKQFKKACHYTNLQPLWADENIQKSNKILV